MQAHEQTLQAGADAGSISVGLRCLSSLGRSSGSSTRVCSRTAEQVLATCGAVGALTRGRWSVAAQSWNTAVVSRLRRDFREPCEGA